MIISYDKFKEKQQDLKDYEESIKKLIDEYVSYNHKFREKYNLNNKYTTCHSIINTFLIHWVFQ